MIKAGGVAPGIEQSAAAAKHRVAILRNKSCAGNEKTPELEAPGSHGSLIGWADQTRVRLRIR